MMNLAAANSAGIAATNTTMEFEMATKVTARLTPGTFVVGTELNVVTLQLEGAAEPVSIEFEDAKVSRGQNPSEFVMEVS